MQPIKVSTRWAISATLVMAAALGVGRFAYTPLLPQMVDYFGWDFAAAGDVASANFFGYMVGALFAPWVAQSVHVRLWVAVSLMASVLTTYLGAEVEQYLSWLLIRFASGVASAFCLVVITTNLIAALSQDGNERLGNVHFAGVGMGILACMASVYLPGDVATQWARLGMVAAFFMALAWLLVANLAWHRPATAKAESAGAVNGHLWRLIIGYGFFGYGYVVAATFVVAMAVALPNTGFDARTVWTIVGLALVPSVYLWQWLANRWGTLPALRAAYLVEAVGLVMAALSTSSFMLGCACVLLGGTFGAITALGISAAKNAAPERMAYAVSAMTVAFAVGQWLGPAIAGRMADALDGFFWPSVTAAALLAAAAILVGRVPRRLSD